MNAGGTTSDIAGKESLTISTGHSVELPAELEATMLGAVFAAPKEAVSELLPDGLRPVRATPTGKAAVTLLSVEYRAVSVPDLDPYDEFAVILPASHTSPASVPYASALMEATNGYVWYMPVTTEPARAFGADVWGFPKVVADIAHRDEGSARETTVSVDGQRFVTLTVERPPAIENEDDGFSYTTHGGRLHRVGSEIEAEAGVWPFSSSVSVTLGDHPKAEPLRGLGLGGRALGRISLNGTVRFSPAEPV